MQATQLLLSLLLVVTPLVGWSHPRLRPFDFGFSDNLIWWLSSLQCSALLTLWLGCFRTIPFLSVFLLLTATSTFVRLRVDTQETPREPRGFGPTVLGALIAAAALAPASLYLGVPRGGDLLAYHLPMAAQWVQTQSIFAQDSRVWFYPGGSELLTAIFFMFARTDVLWFVPDILAWALLTTTLYRLLTGLAVSANAAALWTAAIMLTPLVHRLLGRGGNDLWVAALATSATEALLRAMMHGRRQPRAVALLCLGALASTKYSAIAWSLLGVVYVVLQRKASFRPFRALETVAILVTAALAFSFPLRNLWLTGNPLYPTGIGTLVPWGDTSHLVSMIPKITPDQLGRTTLLHHPWSTWWLLLKKASEAAPVVPIVLGGALVFNSIAWQSFSFTRHDRFVGLAAALGSVLFATQPLVVENLPGTMNQLASGRSLRFALPPLILLTALACAKLPNRRSTITAAAALALSVVCSFGHLLAFMLIAGGVTTGLWAANRYAERALSRVGSGFAYAGLALPLLLTGITNRLSGPREEREARGYRYAAKTALPASIQNSSCPLVIVASTALRTWPLIGSSFRHRVVSVGMSLPAEEFAQQATRHGASVVIAAKDTSSRSGPTRGKFPPETARILGLLGTDWETGYDDGFAVAFTKKSAQCWRPIVRRDDEPPPSVNDDE